MEVIINQKRNIPFTIKFGKDEDVDLTIGHKVTVVEHHMVDIEVSVLITDITSIKNTGEHTTISGFGIEC